MSKNRWEQTVLTNGPPLIILGLMVGLVMIWNSPLSIQPGRDSGFFLYAGGQILKGKLPYVDFWDSKGPGIFFVNALGLWIGKGSRWGVWLLEFLFLTTSSFLFFQSVTKKFGRGAALASCAAWLFGFSRVMDGGNLTEEYSLFFSLILLASFLQFEGYSWKTLSLLLGITSALSFLFRANNIGTQVSVFLAVLVWLLLERRFATIFWFFLWTALAAAIVLGLASIPFLSDGTFTNMFDAAILYNFYYSGSSHHVSLNFWDGIKAIGWPAYTALAGYAASIFWLIRGKLREIFPIYFIALLVIDWPVDILLSSISSKYYLHYYISWLPALAMLNVAGFVILSRFVFSTKLLQMLESRRQGFVLVLLGLVFFYITSGALLGYKDVFVRIFFERQKGLEKTDPVSSYIKDKTKTGEYVLTWGAYPVLNYLSRRDAPTAYLFYPAYENSPFTDQMSRTFYQDISTKKPAMIVDAFSMSPDYVLSLDSTKRSSQLRTNSSQLYHPAYQDEFFAFVAENYQLIDTVNGFDIYRPVSSGN